MVTYKPKITITFLDRWNSFFPYTSLANGESPIKIQVYKF